jgi:hypothetical protein
MNDALSSNLSASGRHSSSFLSQGSDSQYGAEDERKELLPTFTNEVIVIRPEYFYENVDCQLDNKFMKSSPAEAGSTN